MIKYLYLYYNGNAYYSFDPPSEAQLYDAMIPDMIDILKIDPDGTIYRHIDHYGWSQIYDHIIEE